MPKYFLNDSKTTFKKSWKRVFWAQKWSKYPPQRSKIWPEILILGVIYRPFELKIHPKVCVLRLITMPKRFLNNSETSFKISRKRLFWVKKWSKYPPQRAKIWPEILISGVIYRPFKLKIHPKVGLLRLITMPKHFLNNSETTFKNSRKRLFWPQKWSKHGCQYWQKRSIFGSIFEIWALILPCWG